MQALKTTWPLCSLQYNSVSLFSPAVLISQNTHTHHTQRQTHKQGSNGCVALLLGCKAFSFAPVLTWAGEGCSSAWLLVKYTERERDINPRG